MRFHASFFEGTRPNQGPGFHTDEASSAIESLLRHGLPRADATALAGPRDNPSEADGADDEDERIMSRGELFEPAMLVTGQWGLDKHELRRSLPIYGVRENPKTVRDYDTFFERMRKLERVLTERRDLAEKRYKKLGRAKMPWVVAFDKAIAAVFHVIEQEKRPASKRTILSGSGKDAWFLGLPKKGSWNPISKKGNAKLPFVAYSELPMATCPGALKCRIDYDAYEPGSKGYRGWCYSFGSWMRAAPFLVQFLNTLANYADREFAILANGGSADPREHTSRVRAAIKGKRVWMDFVRDATLAYTAKGRLKATSFLRLFVDGDVNTEDQIVAWMRVVKEMGPDAGTHGVQVYGYSKCWNQFLNVDKMMGSDFWPENYTLNMSSGSAYEGIVATREAMKKLPISRGYFEAIPISGYMEDLEKQIALFRKSPDAVVPMPKRPFTQFEFDPEHVRTFLRIQGLKTWAEAVAMFPALADRAKEREVENIRKRAMRAWLVDLVRHPKFGAVVQKELAKDEGDAIDATEAAQKRRLMILMREIAVEAPAVEPGKRVKDPSDPTIDEEKKAFALVLHEVTWTFGLGGSCPLVCGNCSDEPTGGTKGVHRCAARPGSAFWHATVHIGIH